MANKVESQARAGLLKVTLDTTEAYAGLGDASQDTVGTWILHVIVTAGSFVPKIRAMGSGQTGVSCVYWNAATDTNVTAGTAISASGIYGIPCDGCDLILDYTHAAGGIVVWAVRTVG
jgi:hypothetical protein